MSCCGDKRRRLAGRPSRRAPEAASKAALAARAAPTPRRAPAASAAALFEYVGRTSLSVVGGWSRRRYHFALPGARLAVDGRDAPSLAAVPNLRRVVDRSGAS